MPKFKRKVVWADAAGAHAFVARCDDTVPVAPTAARVTNQRTSAVCAGPEPIDTAPHPLHEGKVINVTWKATNFIAENPEDGQVGQRTQRSRLNRRYQVVVQEKGQKMDRVVERPGRDLSDGVFGEVNELSVHPEASRDRLQLRATEAPAATVMIAKSGVRQFAILLAAAKV